VAKNVSYKKITVHVCLITTKWLMMFLITKWQVMNVSEHNKVADHIGHIPQWKIMCLITQQRG